MKINENILNLKPYNLSSHKAWDQPQNKQVLKLDWNESTIPPSPLVKKSIENFLEVGNLNWYPDTENKNLLNALSNYLELDKKYLDYFPSSDSVHEYISRLLVSNGDQVMIIGPTYDNFRACVESYGAKIFKLNASKKENFILSEEIIIEKISLINPSLVYICNPNNPTGISFNKDFIRKICIKFPEIGFIIDEAYYEFSLITNTKDVLDLQNLIICRTFSKAFGLASFRIGYVVSSVDIIVNLKKIKNHKNISSFAQIAADAALKDIQYMRNYVNSVKLGMKKFKNWSNYKNLDIYAGPTNFALVDFGSNAKNIIDKLESQNIFIRKFSNFINLESHLRITIGNEEQITKLVSIIDE